MFGWRKRNDGFEWREYVRTTILLRRKHRRDKINDIGRAAVDGVKDAGRAGAEAGARGFAAGAEKAKAAFVAAASVPGRAGAAGAPVLRRILDASAHGLSRLLAAVQTPPLAKPLAAVAMIAGVAGPARIIYGGVDGAGIAMIVIAALGLFAYLAPRDGGAARRPGADRVAQWGAVMERLGARVSSLPLLDRLPPKAALASLAAMAVTLAGGGWWAARHSGGVAALVPAPLALAGKKLEGRAVAVSGDQLRIGRTTVTLDGIESPERDQTCPLNSAKTWRCGQAAAQAMAKLIRGATVTCRVAKPDAGGVARGSCEADGKDLARELVGSGYVFAADSSPFGYGRFEGAAKDAKLGLWRGAPERPSDYRAKRWEEAKKQAPSGCPIKGQVTAEGGRVYVLPWSPRYERVKIQTGRGGRWFCSEEEAQAAGWKPGERS